MPVNVMSLVGLGEYIAMIAIVIAFLITASVAINSDESEINLACVFVLTFVLAFAIISIPTIIALLL